jgi:DNA-binding NtrC family response regulator
MGRLSISLGSLPILAVTVDEEKTRLGRSRENEIVLPLPEIGETHAEIVSTDETAVIRACSGERLLVNGRSVDEATLADGDVVSLGGYRLVWFFGCPGQEDDTVSGVEIPGTRGIRPIRTPTDDRSRDIRNLVVTSRGGAPEEVRFKGPRMMVGRSPDCDLVLTDDAVSWRHLALEKTAEGMSVHDLGSSNGTFLDGRRIESAVAVSGSVVSLGHTALEFLAADDERAREHRTGLAEMVGASAVMQEIYDRVLEVGGSRVPVLLLGETGTGKELAARAIHSLGPRKEGPFIPVNCAAIPRETMEDELFGHVRGAFTGATTDRAGAFERGDGGTILLDEIGQLASDLQAKLLRVVEDGEIPRLGGTMVRSDFRVLAATNRDLGREVASERFRQDLYYRLAVEQIRLPRLVERLEDIPDLVQTFLHAAQERWGLPEARHIRVEPEAVELLARHSWPGNVRELRNLILRAAARATASVIGPDSVEALLQESRLPGPQEPSAGSLEDLERDTLRKVLHDCSGQRRAAARRLGIAESTLYDKIKRYAFEDVGRPG